MPALSAVSSSTRSCDVRSMPPICVVVRTCLLVSFSLFLPVNLLFAIQAHKHIQNPLLSHHQLFQICLLHATKLQLSQKHSERRVSEAVFSKCPPDAPDKLHSREVQAFSRFQQDNADRLDAYSLRSIQHLLAVAKARLVARWMAVEASAARLPPGLLPGLLLVGLEGSEHVGSQYLSLWIPPSSCPSMRLVRSW